MRGTICEVQVATVAAHLFNELEHDIAYKELAEFSLMATHWRGPRTVLRRVIQSEVGMGAPMEHNTGSDDDAVEP